MVAPRRGIPDHDLNRYLFLLRSLARAARRLPPPHRSVVGIVAVIVALTGFPGVACTPIESSLPADEATSPSSPPGTAEDPGSVLFPGFDSALALGEKVPNLELTTQLGTPLDLADLSGTVIVLGFFSCQHSEGSPGAAAARRLLELQETLRSDLWDRVRIVTVSTEPLLDTPEVLLRCGQDLGTDFDRWTLTATTSADFSATAARLGVLIWDEEGDETSHTLSTLVIDRHGLLADRFRGLTQWSVGDLIAAVVQTAER